MAGESSGPTLVIIAGVLGGLALLTFVVLLLRAYYWRKAKDRRIRQQQDVVERFSLEFLSQKLDDSMSMSRQHRTSGQSHNSSEQFPMAAQPLLGLQRPFRQQTTPTISENHSGSHCSTSSEGHSTPGPGEYVNTSQRQSYMSLRGDGSSTLPAQHATVKRSDSDSSMEVNPNYRASACMDPSVQTADTVDKTSTTGASPASFEPSVSALQRPYATLGSDSLNQIVTGAANDHYQTPSPTMNGKNKRLPSGLRSGSQSSDVFFDGGSNHQNRYVMHRTSPQPSKAGTTSMSGQRLRAPSQLSSISGQLQEDEDEYVPMMSSRHTSIATVPSESSSTQYQNLSAHKSRSSSSSAAAVSEHTNGGTSYQNILRLSTSKSGSTASNGAAPMNKAAIPTPAEDRTEADYATPRAVITAATAAPTDDDETAL